MIKIAFTQLGFWPKLALTLVPFMGWVMFAEFVIDRHGWGAVLPFYRVGNFCIYDAVVLAASLFAWAYAEYDAKKRATIPGCC
jgi:hypothetical protein